MFCVCVLFVVFCVQGLGFRFGEGFCFSNFMLSGWFRFESNP